MCSPVAKKTHFHKNCNLFFLLKAATRFVAYHSPVYTCSHFLKDKFYKITILIPQDKKLKLKFNYDCCFILIQHFFQSLILSLISVVIPSNSWLFDCVNKLINCRKLQTAGNSWQQSYPETFAGELSNFKIAALNRSPSNFKNKICILSIFILLLCILYWR